ncbi:MAG: sugar ABC transporter permease [Vallitaleaceae bacterium]|nr:sugar ABC transporter permease [Vallitaleaceae bacterium]
MNLSMIKKNLNSWMMIVSLIVICIVFGILTKGIFLSPRNLSMLTRQTTVVGILSIGMMFVIVATHIDLSVGAIVGLTGTVAAVLQVWFHVGTIPTILIVVFLGILCGLAQGYWVAYRGVPAFIITLGGLLIFKGIKLGISKGASIAPMQDSYKAISQSYLNPTFSLLLGLVAVIAMIIMALRRRQSKIKYGFPVDDMKLEIGKLGIYSMLIIGAVLALNLYKGLPTALIILIIFVLIFSFIGNNTVFGRNIYSIGGNEEASKLSGIKTERVVLMVFAINAALASAAGIVLTARLNSATAASGDGLELDAIAACVIGGTSMSGGKGKIIGVVIGALIMASLDNGMSLINLENFWQYIVKGMVLVLAVWIDTASKKK